jgi:hypothetical protein
VRTERELSKEEARGPSARVPDSWLAMETSVVSSMEGQSDIAGLQS